MFLLVSVRHVGAHPDEFQHGVSIQSSINLGKTFLRISRIRIIPSTQILARVFVYLPPFICKILDFICRMVLILILIYFEWRGTENQQYLPSACPPFFPPFFFWIQTLMQSFLHRFLAEISKGNNTNKEKNVSLRWGSRGGPLVI